MRVWFHFLATTVIATLLVCFLGCMTPGHAQVTTDSTDLGEIQAAGPDSSANSEEAVIDPTLNQQKLYDLYKHAGVIGQMTMLVLAFGVFLIVRQALQLRSDARDSKWVLEQINQVKINNVDKLDGIERLISKLDGAHSVWVETEGKKLNNLFKPTLDACRNILRTIKSLISRGKENEDISSESAAKTTVFQLFSKLYEVFKATEDTDGFSDEVSNYNQYLKDKFNPFLTRLAYLSDSAGALGLLGTVWGMFLTFFSGSMEQAEIIQGMGIALATTIIGIVVSLILNTFSTMVSNKFDAHLEIISKMTSDFQVRLMRAGLVTGKPAVVQSSPEVVYAQPPKVVEAPPVAASPAGAQPVKPASVSSRTPGSIEFVEKQIQYQKASINQELPKELMVIIKDQDNYELDGITVTFELDDADGGTLNGGAKVDYVQTAGGGIARTKWKLGKKAGNKVVRVKADGLESQTLRFFAEALPEAPNQLVELTGNFQTGHPGELLEKPLSVRVEDKFQNPIPGINITFTLKEGAGNFQNIRAKETHVETNEQGIAEVFF